MSYITYKHNSQPTNMVLIAKRKVLGRQIHDPAHPLRLPQNLESNTLISKPTSSPRFLFPFPLTSPASSTAHTTLPLLNSGRGKIFYSGLNCVLTIHGPSTSNSTVKLPSLLHSASLEQKFSHAPSMSVIAVWRDAYASGDMDESEPERIWPWIWRDIIECFPVWFLKFAVSSFSHSIRQQRNRSIHAKPSHT
jgi:hypothetical protein